MSEPLSDYSRWLLHATRQNVACGEDIRYLWRDRAVELGIPYEDYWLLDSRRALVFHFDDDGRTAGQEPVDDPARIVKFNYWRDVAWRYAIKWKGFAEQHGQG